MLSHEPCMLAVQLNSLEMSKLSILKNVHDGCITYYVGDNYEHVEHLRYLNDVELICHQGFNPNFSGVSITHVDNPQLEFYKLSTKFKEDYLDYDGLIYHEKYKSHIHINTVIGDGVRIGPGCVIGEVTIGNNVHIHPNTTIYSKSVIGDGVIIEGNSVIGSTGVMWVWDGDEKVYLEQLGNVIIEDNCRIGSLVVIVRGSANESTIIDEGTCIAHGTLIGHGSYVGKHCHFANGIKLGGSSYVSDYNFLGCGVTLSPGVKLLDNDIIVGAGATVTKTVTKSGVYVGVPAKKIKEVSRKMSGIPTWRK